GSLLMQQWYGKKARPPADLDLECFDRPDIERQYDPAQPPYDDPEQHYGPSEGRYGRWGNFVSRLDLGKALGRSAMWQHEGPESRSGLPFGNDRMPPDGGASLWVYGTPGKRYYTSWEWPGHEPAAGSVQLDLATPGPYSPDEIGVTEETFTAPGGETF